MGFFTVDGSSNGGETWVNEITQPAADMRQATALLLDDLAGTFNSAAARRVLALWDKNKGEAVVTDSGRAYNLDKNHWRFRYQES
jgi:hypothetical protein